MKNRNNKYSKNNKSNKGRRNYTKSNSQSQFDKQNDLESKTNDPSWYAADESILRDAASLPFSWSVGTTVDVGLADDFVVPGICAIHTMPTFGYAQTFADPLNVAATAVYSNIRYANSGSANYDAPDLMMYILAMSQVYSYINMLQRIYGVAMLYTQRNRYLPKALLKAMNVDFQDVQNNLASFRYNINVLVNKAASFAVPNTFTLFNRQAFLYQNVYCEGPSIKDQMYLYVPDGFYQYGLVEKKSGLGYIPFNPSVLGAKTSGSDLFTVDQLIIYGSALLQSLLASEDMNIMSGDILKAYGDNGIVKLAPIAPDYTITPIFDAAVLEQMKNAIALEAAYHYASNSTPFYNVSRGIQTAKTVSWKHLADDTKFSTSCVYQDVATNNVMSQPLLISVGTASDDLTAMAKRAYGKYKPLLTTQNAETNPSLVIESSRLIATVEPETIGNIGRPIFCGSEVATHFTLWVNKLTTVDNSLELEAQPYVYGTMCFTRGTGYTDPVDVMFMTTSDISVLSAFKYRPLVVLLEGAQADNKQTFTFKGINGDIDNYAVLDQQIIRKLHEAALLNQLHVKSIARV